jgi:membrane protein DedA with SNARE-associated domain
MSFPKYWNSIDRLQVKKLYPEQLRLVDYYNNEKNVCGYFTPFANFFFNNIHGFSVGLFNEIKELFNEWGFWVVFTAGFTVTAGVFDLNFMLFCIASFISRGARFFLVAFLIWRYGPNIKRFIDKYFNLLAIGFTVLLIGGFVLIKYLM